MFDMDGIISLEFKNTGDNLNMNHPVMQGAQTKRRPIHATGPEHSAKYNQGFL